VNLRLRRLLPAEGGRAPAEPWRAVFTALDDRALDLAVGPFADVPARFAARTLGHEDFVVVARAGHPFAATAGLEAYCAAGHILVSQTGDARGFVDRELEALGLARRVAPTVPGFFMALTLAARTDLPAAVPRSFAAARGPALGLAVTEAALALPRFATRSVLPRVALADAGVAWLCSVLAPEPR
jgi:DNA-binding transcriptional LysR family regulator